MKKILVWITVSMFFVMMPFVLFAKEPISENDLGSITAQEGVTIEFGGASFATSHFVINGKFAPTINSWGDGNGCTTCGGYTGAGWVGYRDLTMGGLEGGLDSMIAVYNNMTIDVGTSGTATKLFVGLPSALVHPTRTSFTLALGTTKDLNDGQQALGSFYNNLFALVVNPVGTGVMSISNHSATNQQGLDIGFSGNTVLYGDGVLFSIPNTPVDQSWGDADGDQSGATGYNSAGYFGAKGLLLGTAGAAALPNYFNIKLSGTMTIDVGTDTATSTTAIVIGVPTINLYDANITTPVVFATNKELTTNVQSLGTLYTGGISMSPSGSLTITAH